MGFLRSQGCRKEGAGLKRKLSGNDNCECFCFSSSEQWGSAGRGPEAATTLRAWVPWNESLGSARVSGRAGISRPSSKEKSACPREHPADALGNRKLLVKLFIVTTFSFLFLNVL